MSLLGSIDRGSSNPSSLWPVSFLVLPRAKIIISVKWMSHEANAFANEISKWLIPYVWSVFFSPNSICWTLYGVLIRVTFPLPTRTIFVSSSIRCIDVGILPVSTPSDIIGAMIIDGLARLLNIWYWRKLMVKYARTTFIVPLRKSSTWWHLIAPNAVQLSRYSV